MKKKKQIEDKKFQCDKYEGKYYIKNMCATLKERKRLCEGRKRSRREGRKEGAMESMCYESECGDCVEKRRHH